MVTAGILQLTLLRSERCSTWNDLSMTSLLVALMQLLDTCGRKKAHHIGSIAECVDRIAWQPFHTCRFAGQHTWTRYAWPLHCTASPAAAIKSLALVSSLQVTTNYV
jgi:hypothetical protein